MTTTMHIKTDKSLKQKAVAFANKSGLSLSTLVNLTLRQAILNQKVVVDLSPEPNSETKVLLEEGLKQRKTGKGFSPKFSSIESAKQWLTK